METLHIPYAELLLVKCSGLSLSDQYWVTPCDAPQNWRDVNFYENDFSDDVGRALFGEGFSRHSRICVPPAIPQTAFYKSAGALRTENESS